MSHSCGSSAKISADGAANSCENGRKDPEEPYCGEETREEEFIASDEAKILRDKIHELYELRAAHVDKLSEAYKVVYCLMENNGDSKGISLKMESFNNAWKGFVDVHEKFFVLLKGESERDYACSIYEEQRDRKLNLDAMVTEWCNRQKMAQVNLEDVQSRPYTRSSRSGNSDESRASSKLSRQSRKKEKMALAQLKLENRLKDDKYLNVKSKSSKENESLWKQKWKLNKL